MSQQYALWEKHETLSTNVNVRCGKTNNCQNGSNNNQIQTKQNRKTWQQNELWQQASKNNMQNNAKTRQHRRTRRKLQRHPCTPSYGATRPSIASRQTRSGDHIITRHQNKTVNANEKGMSAQRGTTKRNKWQKLLQHREITRVFWQPRELCPGQQHEINDRTTAHENNEGLQSQEKPGSV